MVLLLQKEGSRTAPSCSRPATASADGHDPRTHDDATPAHDDDAASASHDGTANDDGPASDDDAARHDASAAATTYCY
jgi:hypothetical protein